MTACITNLLTTQQNLHPSVHTRLQTSHGTEMCASFLILSTKYLGGTRTRNFARGPGFFGTGRSAVKEFRTFSDFNLFGRQQMHPNVSKPGIPQIVV